MLAEKGAPPNGNDTCHGRARPLRMLQVVGVQGDPVVVKQQVLGELLRLDLALIVASREKPRRLC